MVNILKEADSSGRHLVTKKGHVVTIYTDKASGTWPVHGSVRREGVDILSSWDVEGFSAVSPDYNLTLYDVGEHFNWRWLPKWAEKYIYKKGTQWFCGNDTPLLNKEVSSYVPHINHIPIPTYISDTILMECTDVDSLFINPKYKT